MKPCLAIKMQMVFGFLVLSLFSNLISVALAQSDPAFNAQVDNPVYAMTVQPNGRIATGGQLTLLDGVPRNHLGRLYGDGSLDTAFNPGANDNVYTSVVLTNGQILVGGSFTNLAGQPRSHLGRLNPDGTLDTAFNPGADGIVYSLLLQSDGKIVVAGSFTNLAGQLRNSIGRLNADGSPDGTFSASSSNAVYTLTMQPDGKILVGGAFLGFNGVATNYICRLNTNGVLDTNFVASPDNEIHSLAVQADGRILAGGLFYYMDGEIHNDLARLNTNGTVDSSFTASVRPGYLGDTDTIVVQSDGKILAGGTAIGWFGFPYFARFNSDGTVDTNFTANVPSGVHSIAIQRDGKILNATYYTLGRLTNAPAIESLTYTNSTITWLRGGGSPEVWRTTFESSTNLTNWVSLGAGTRIAGGWQRTGVSARTNASIRARGFVAGGYHNASQSYVEAYAGPVVVLTQPASRTNNAGTTATFTVQADGSPTLAYRWRKNGVNLSDGGNLSGSTSATLALTNVLRADAAAYSVVVSNNFGAVTSAVANLTVVDPFISSPPANQYVDVSQTVLFSVTATGTALSYQWLMNGVALPGQTNASLTLTNVPGADAGGTFSVVVTNTFGSVTSLVAFLTVNVATVDSLNPVPNYEVRSVAVQPDGKILMSGMFSAVSGQTQVGVARLNSDGSLDTNFTGGLLGIPFSTADPLVALQSDGKILLAGGISYVDGAPRNRVGRLNPDGSLDTAFNPGASDDIYAMTAQLDGKIVVGGSFTNLAGQACNRIGRLNADGTFDTNFTAAADGTVYAIALQADGKVLVGGNFAVLGGQSRTNLGRFNADGTTDLGFNPGANATVNAIAVLTNGSIAVGGNFTSLAGQPLNYLGRLDINGVPDAGFNPGLNGPVESLAVQVDGRLVLGGTFTLVGGFSRTNLARLNSDGNADATFNPGADNTVLCVAVQPDGEVIAAGQFGSLDGQPRQFIGRLNRTGSATNILTFNSTTITWQRSGTGPEIWQTTFAASTNGADWVQQNGTRVAGGWQATGLNLNGDATIQARGFVAGSSDGSSWFVENVVGPAVILSQPASQTNNPFTVATFAVSATGQGLLGYHWLKNGAGLEDGGNIAGAYTATLSVSNVLGGDAASYQVVVTNMFGSITSAVASLTVLDPQLTSQPATQTNNAGQTVVFNATALGTMPLNYQWLKNGSNLADGGNVSGALTPTLTLTNVLGGDAGAYQLVISNVWGSTTSVVAGLSVVDPLLVTNPAGQFVNRGQTATFSVSVLGTQPLQYQWRKDGAILVGATLPSLTLTNVQATNTGGYDVVATDAFGSVTSAVATLTINVAAADSLNPAANAQVNALAIQADGKILLGGAFTNVSGLTLNRIARLNPDGTLDTTFNPGASGNVQCLAVQPDGKILVGGSFTNLSGQPRNYLGRLNTDGSLDTAFNPNPNWVVYTLVAQPDGTILIGGGFSLVGGLSCTRIGRLNADGSLDTSFTPSADDYVYALAVQPDGKILVSGQFDNLDGQSRTNLGRLNPDGTLDTVFAPLSSFLVVSMAVQADEKILVGGNFSTLGGQTRNNIGRLNSDGSLDAPFNPGADNYVNALAVQADGQIVVGGFFSTLGGQARANIGRLNADGSLDTAFNPGANGWVNTLAVQADGSILAGGSFTAIAGQSRNRIARLNDAGVATQSLLSDATSITWPRGGAGPEIAAASFETTTNGTSWTALGEGQRISGGWQLSGLTLPANATIRARGFTTSVGFQCSSSWFVETFGGAPLLSSQPVNCTNNAATTAAFSVTSVGAAPISYQWLKNGTNLSDVGNISGSTTATLTLSNVFGADAGGYSVVLSNASGTVTSAVATLTVIDPLLTGQPVNQFTNAGQTVSFSVTVLGTQPLYYRWRQNGVELTGATSSTLTLTNLQATNAGNYDVVVTNAFGSVTSAVAVLTLNLAVPDSFNPGANGQVVALAVQPDGKILVGGSFTTLGGQSCNRLGRLNPDGTLDAPFNPGAGSGGNGVSGSGSYTSVSGLLVQSDWKIVVAGTRSDRQTASYVWRIDSAGNPDTNFVTALTGPVNALALQADGKIWVGGSFTVGKPAITTDIARLFGDGTLDSNFVATANAAVNALALQPDGKLLVGGVFTTLDGTNLNHIARLNVDGTIDTNFNPNANSTVYTLAVQADGKILLGGAFTTLGGTNRNHLARLNADGTLDTNFNPNVTGLVNTLALQTDGRILLGGSFTTVGGQTRNRLSRLNADGSVDTTFNPGANNTIYALAIQADGAIVVGGGGTSAAALTVLGGQSRTNIGRLSNSDPATQNLSFDGSTVTWLRGGTSPEVWRTTFEVSTNGADWVNLGAGGRVTGGWQLSGVIVPANANICARGYLSGGQYNGSAWFVENIMGPALVVTQPVSQTNNAGTTAVFRVAAGGTPTLTYQWYRNGTALGDGGNISGTISPTLTLSNVLGGDAGDYSVIISNSWGSITSSVATLFIIEPVITLQPANQFADAGQSANFTVAAIGSAPFTYQWRKNGTNISAPNSPTLTLADVSSADLGTYSVLVSTPYGSAVSSNAALTINLAVPDSLSVNASGQVCAMAVQSDGKILVGGSFTNLGGQLRNFIGRLNPDGTTDPDFNPGADNLVNCFAVQPDGKILVGGYFQNLSGQIRTCIARLCADGTLDTNFAPSVSLGGTPFVNALVIQPDGKILVGGQLGLLNGQFIPNLGRLNPDGSVDNSFSCPINSPGVLSLALQSDGRIMAGGWFCNNWCYLDRLNTNGAVDTTFNTAPSGVIDAIIIQPDGKILVGGNFVSLLSTTRNYLARLNPNCTLDSAFNPGANGPVTSLALQADGKILVGGSFTTLAGLARTNLGRLNSDGSIDTTFFPSASSNVQAIALQPDGAVLVGGLFTNVCGQSRSGLARLTPTDLGSQSLSSDGQTVTWLRAGTTPEVWRATFETSTDGSNWIAAGSATRIPGGWGLSGLSLSVNSLIRARGFTTGGYYTGSSWFVESIAQVSPLTPPGILTGDGGLGFHAGAFGFNVRGLSGQVIVIEASTDFIQWTPIQTNLVTDAGLFVFTDPQSSLFSNRFYRARIYDGILPAPAILTAGSNIGFTTNGFGFDLTGVAGQTLIIECSTNLSAWTALATNTLESELLYFTDLGATNSPCRFYRLRLN